jgi:hypothetical protein
MTDRPFRHKLPVYQLLKSRAFIRCSIFSLLSFVLTFQWIHAQSPEELTFGTDSTLDVVSWNIEWFPKSGATTVDYVVSFARSMDADVYAIQEIDNGSYFNNLPDELEGWEVYFNDSEYLELGYLYNPESIEVIDIYEILTGDLRRFPRPPLVMELLFNNIRYVIINNHWKCCGDGVIDPLDPWDEETRRRDACIALKNHIDSYLEDENVILLGDLNDVLIDSETNNVFIPILNEPWNYKFADMEIAQGTSSGWSYPSWPSHIDHIMITNELFDDLEKNGSDVRVIKPDHTLPGGFDEYDQRVSDHRPVGIKLMPKTYAGMPGQSDLLVEPYVRPNPVRESATISFSLQEEGILEVFDISGKKVRERRLEPASHSILFHTGGLAPGIYLARIKTGSSVSKPFKLILER